MYNAQTYLITGTSRGLGFELAKYILENTDALVLGIARTEAPQAFSKYANYKHFPVDITDKQGVISLFQEFTVNKSIPEVVILNAAIREDANWEKVFKTNLNAPLFLIKQCNQFKQINEIIVINSVFAWFSDSKNFAYAASKSALSNAVNAFRVSPTFKNTKLKQVYLGPLAEDGDRSGVLFSNKKTIARKILQIVNRRKSDYYITFANFMFSIFFKVSPVKFANRVLNKIRR